MPGLDEQLLAEVGSSGPILFERFVEQALYDADAGFYATHGQAGGRRGDFVTSVEIGPLFAAVIGDWLDGVWRGAGRPKHFRVAEVGAGVGTLFRGLHRSAPECFGSLTYTLVERSAGMKVAHQSLPSEQWSSATALPVERQHVILANELLDNLAFGIAERLADGWSKVRVGMRHRELALTTDTNTSPELSHLTELAPGAIVGTRVPVAGAAATWVESAVAAADRVLIFDYAATTAELAVRGQDAWLRTYVGHNRGSDPLADIGRRDITYDVPLDQLPPATTTRRQADWLNANGLEARVEAARTTWNERAHIGDLAAIAARSAVGEAAALTDPAGLGAFWALEWHTG